MARVSFPCLCLTIPWHADFVVSGRKAHAPPDFFLMHAPPPLPTHRSHSRGPSPHCHVPICICISTPSDPDATPPLGAWARASGSDPPCPPSHMPASLHAAVFGWITALKSLEVLQPGAPVLARKAVSPLGKGYLPQGRSRVLIRGATSGRTLSRESALKPSDFILRLGPWTIPAQGRPDLVPPYLPSPPD